MVSDVVVGGWGSVSEGGGEEVGGWFCCWREMESGSSRRKETEARMSARVEGFLKARDRGSAAVVVVFVVAGPGPGRFILSGWESWRGR